MADGKKIRFYIMVHKEEMVGWLYQEKADFGGADVNLIRSYGLLEKYRSKGLGAVLLYVIFKELAKSYYIVADIDEEHPESLACFTRTARAFGRVVKPIGRIIEGGTLEPNRHPRYEDGETMEYLAKLKGAPEVKDR